MTLAGTTTGRGHTTWIVVVMLLVSLTTSTSPVHAQDDNRDQVREDLEAADRDLSAAQVRLDAAQASLDRIDREANKVAADLAVAQAELAAARAVAGTANIAARDAAEDLVATGDVAAERAAAALAEAELANRAIWMWKHGAAATASLQITLAAGARSTHDLAVGQRVVDRLVDDSRDAAEVATLHFAQVVASRDVGQRDDHRRTAFEAQGQVASISLLERRQTVLAEELEDLRREALLVVSALRNDRDAVSALARELRETLAQVSLSGALVPPADLPLDGPPPPWINELPSAGQQWAVAIDVIATRNGLDGALFTALVWSESAFHAAAVSRAGAIGLAQLMPGTAAGLGVDPWNPWENLDGGSRYLHAQINRFGSADLGLAAYNAGPGRVIDAGYAIPDIVETQLYVVRVLQRWELLRNAG